MPDHPSSAKCPACGSTALVTGRLTETYWVRDGGFGGWSLYAFVCRDCGVLTPHLSVDDLQTLRDKTAEPAAAERSGL